MKGRSLGSRLAIGSALWTLGSLALAFTVGLAIVHHSPRAVGAVHYLMVGFSSAVVMAAGWAYLQRTLSPFVDLRRRLQAVRDGHAAQVDGTFPPEVQPLVQDLNALLAHQADAVVRARSRAGDLAHGLKTPLAVLAHEADRAAHDGHAELADAIRQQVARIERQIAYHLAHARAAASGSAAPVRASVLDSVEGLRRVLDRAYADRAIAVDIDVTAAATARVERGDLDEMLGNLLDNGWKWARQRVRIGARLDGSRLYIEIDDDGAGLDPSLRVSVLQRGVRADATAPGTGLGLAIVRDLAELYGGAIALGDSPLGGVRATLELPAVVEGHQTG